MNALGTTAGQDARRGGNPLAYTAVLVALLAVAAVPAGVGAAWKTNRIELVVGVGAGAVASLLLGLVAIALARRGAGRVQLTLGRSGGAGIAATARLLAWIAVWAALTAGLALAFYGVLLLFAK